MARKPPATLADYLLVGISPALIMFLIGSLVFYLLAMFYRGEHGMRLCFVFAMFIMGAVAVGRLSMEEGVGYASLFGGALGLVSFIGISSFVKYEGALAWLSPALNLGIIALVWFLAYQLTYDCTLLDEQADTSDRGLLQAVGFDHSAEAEATEEALEATPNRNNAGESENETPVWLKWFERSKQPHAHGVWVIYLSLAALPIFGLGQTFVPREARTYAFGLVVVYVAAALALLLSTSFLGLRRYLRKRRLEMPPEMTAIWLGVGSILIAAVLLFCVLLPRPGAEVAVSQLPSFQIVSPERNPARLNVGNDGQKEDADAHASSQEKTGKSDSQTSGESQSSGNSAQKSDSSGDGEKSKSGEGEQQEKSGQQNASKSGEKSGESQGKSQSANTEKSTSSAENKSEEQSSGARPQQPSPTASQNRSSLPRITATLGQLLKWILYAVVLAVMGYLAWRYRTQLVAAWNQFLQEWRAFWARWFGGKKESANAEVAPPPAPKRFHSFANPFATGEAARMSHIEMIRYTFEALQAWGFERHMPRSSSETPHEYVQRLATQTPYLQAEMLALAESYGLMAYAGGALPANYREPLRVLWGKLAQVEAAL